MTVSLGTPREDIKVRLFCIMATTFKWNIWQLLAVL